MSLSYAGLNKIHSLRSPTDRFDSSFICLFRRTRFRISRSGFLTSYQSHANKLCVRLVVFKIQADERCFRPALFFFVSGSYPRVSSTLRTISARASTSVRLLVKLQMVNNTAVDPRGAEWTSFGPGLSCQCHLWENCTLAVHNHARSETRLTTEAPLQRPRSKVIIDAGPWNSVLSVSSLCSFARGSEPAGAQRRSELGAGQCSSSQAAWFQHRPHKYMLSTTRGIVGRARFCVAGSNVTTASGHPCVDRRPPPTDCHP